MTGLERFGPFDAGERRAIAADLRLLALLHEQRPDRALIEHLRATSATELLSMPPASPDGRHALELFRIALSPFTTPLDGRGLDDLAADHAAIYLTNAFGASPMESPWIDPDGLWGQDAMFQVRDWYRHWGLEVPDWRSRPDDHLVTQLLFVAHLMEATDAPAALVDAARFLDLHLLRWLEPFVATVMKRSWTAYFAGLASLTHAYVGDLRGALERREDLPREEVEPIAVEKDRRRTDETVAMRAAAAAGGMGAAPEARDERP
jgi:TorA maturation chaperone TorD